MSEPRRHHYNPRCWLAGFTSTGAQDGRLYVTDLSRLKQWPSTPAGSAHERDFYKLWEPLGFDPLMFEKWLGEIESDAAPVFKALDEELTGPSRDELEVLLRFIAIQWVRVPAFRSWVLTTAKSIHRAFFEKALRNRKTWSRTLKSTGFAQEASGAGYDRMRAYIESDAYTLAAENDWFIFRGFQMFEDLVQELRQRHWAPLFSENGNFIASDNPVIMDGPKGQTIGFVSAEVVIFTVSRHVALWGTFRPIRGGKRNRRDIARQNTFTMLNATSQVYSTQASFCWSDQDEVYCTDWQLFSKQKFKERGIKPTVIV
jgi:hypothetical protein